ncbi:MULTISPECIES: hypothetical protein [Streptacidiphilus]|uniref:Roadblock/LC7 domain-containing protein n=2 Tax=Streptacidiphilus TaxID=228398 RepID=A0ABV6UPZ2_9ACTN|nr:hypothetical protein [Streptacidiphilus jeojiense]
MPNIDIALKEAMAIDGAIGVAVVDYTSGMALGFEGGGTGLDLSVAAAGNTEVVRAKLRTLEMLNLHHEGIEDILITLTSQYHLIRPLTKQGSQGHFLYLALDRNRANLALARLRLRQIEDNLAL